MQTQLEILMAHAEEHQRDKRNTQTGPPTTFGTSIRRRQSLGSQASHVTEIDDDDDDDGGGSAS